MLIDNAGLQALTGARTLPAQVDAANPFASNAATSPFYSSPTYPHGVYHAGTDKTWFCWEGTNGTNRTAWVRVYNHSTATWGTATLVAIGDLSGDAHGNPSLVRDHQGYWHMFHGPHNASSMQHEVTNSPDNESAWTDVGNVGPAALTYSCPLLVGSQIYLLTRQISAGTMHQIYLKTTVLNLGVSVWSAEASVIRFDAERVYCAYPIVRNGTEIHFIFTRADGPNTWHKHHYYAILDTVTGNLINFDRSVTTIAASLPINLATADSSYRLVQTKHGSSTAIAMLFDAADNPHLIFSDSSISNFGPYAYPTYHRAFISGAWTPDVLIGYVPSFFSDATIANSDDGGIDFYWTQYNPGFSNGGDLFRRHRTPGVSGIWGKSDRILQAGAFAINSVQPVFNGKSGLRLMVAENALSDDEAAVGAGTLRVWPYFG